MVFFLNKKKGGEFADSTALTTVGLVSPYLNHCRMLHFVEVNLKDVFDKGRNFQWPRPSSCPRCQHNNVWGHGFVERLFDLFPSPLPVKRFRCNNCGCIICCRPSTHFDRIQSSRKSIKDKLKHRLTCGRWPPKTPTNRMRHWLQNLKRKVLSRLGIMKDSYLLAAYDKLLLQGHIPVSCSI